MGANDSSVSMLGLEQSCSLGNFAVGKAFCDEHLLGQSDTSISMDSKPQEQQDGDFKQEPTFSDTDIKIQDYVGSEGTSEHTFSCNLEDFRSKKYYLFNAEAHELMIKSLLESTNPSASEISIADPTFQPLPWQNKRGITFNSAIEDRWRDFKAKLGVKIDASRKRFLFHKRDASRYIPHMGQWLEIVKACHIDAAERHWGRNLTKHQITKRWMYGERNHGIPESFVDAFIDNCGCCRRELLPPVPPPPQPSLQQNNKKRKLGKKFNTQMFDVHFIKQRLDEIAQQVAAAQLDRETSDFKMGTKGFEDFKRFEDGSSSEFEKIDEDEQSKLKEKITAIRNEMDSMLVHLPSMSRGKFLHFLEAMDGAITELRNPDLDSQTFSPKLPAIANEIQKPKEAKRVKWKDLARS